MSRCFFVCFHIWLKHIFSKENGEIKAGPGEQQPEKAELGTDLAHQVIGHGGIIPYMPAQTQIHQTAHREFNGADTGDTQEKLFPQGFPHARCDQVDNIKAESTHKEHGPMGIPAPEQLDAAIADGTKKINADKFQSVHVSITNG